MAFRSGDALALCIICGAAVLGMGVERGLQASYDEFDVDTFIDQLRDEGGFDFHSGGHVVRLHTLNIKGLRALEDLDFNYEMVVQVEIALEGLDIDMDELTLTLESLEERLEGLTAPEGIEWTSENGVLEIRDERHRKKRRIIIRPPTRRRGGDGN